MKKSFDGVPAEVVSVFAVVEANKAGGPPLVAVTIQPAGDPGSADTVVFTTYQAMRLGAGVESALDQIRALQQQN